MPYKSRAAQSEYQRNWEKQRRAAWLKEHGPCVFCGATSDLQIDHVDPIQKITHRVWSWAKHRMEAELAKCQVLCRLCHQTKTHGNGDVKRGLLRNQLFGKSAR